jgi:hypothetical protein
VCEVLTSGPSTFAKRRIVTAVSGWRSANSLSDASASTTSLSIPVRGGCGRRMVSSKNAGSSVWQP